MSSRIAMMRLFCLTGDRRLRNRVSCGVLCHHHAAPRMAGLAMSSPAGRHLISDPCRTALLFVAV